MSSKPSARSAFSVLATRNFGSYFAGNLVSALGTWVQNIAQAILIFRLTNSTLAVAVVNFAQFAAVLVLAPWTGSAADRFDRKTLMVASQLFAGSSALLLAVAVAVDRVSPTMIVAAAAAIGLGYAITVPALQAIIPDLVAEQDLPQAISMNAVTFNLARAVGPLLGAAAVTALGFAWSFGLNALSFGLFALLLIATRPMKHPRPETAKRPKFRDGARLLMQQRDLGLLILTVSTVSIASDPVNTLTPGFSVDVFGRSDLFTGILVGIFGAGAVMAAVIPSLRPPVWASAGLAGVGMLVLAASPNLLVALVGLGISGFGFLSSITSATTTIQLSLDANMRGRVMAVWSVAFLGVRPIASLVDGFVAETLGLRYAAAAMTLPVLIVAARLWLRRSQGFSRGGS